MKAVIGAAIAIIGMIGMIAVGAPAVGAPAIGVTAGSSSECTATSGVTVIVDFTHFAGGNIERGCAPGHPTSALTALHAAGFTTAGTTQYGNAFLCRIDGLPKPSQEACTVTPSAAAYWAFWHARPADASWTYSNVGVLDYRPAQGSIEAFAFGGRAQPGISPREALPPPPPPPTTRPTVPPTRPPTTPPPPPVTTDAPPPTTQSPPVSAATPLPGSAPTITSASGVTVAPTTSAATTSTRVTAPPRSTTSTSQPTRVVERSAAGRAPHESSGSPLAAIVTIVVVGSLAIGATAFTRARRRRPA